MAAPKKVQRVKPLMPASWQLPLVLSTGSGLPASDGTIVRLDLQEIATTADEARLWRGDGTYLGGTVDHGSVADATAMAAIYLQTSCTRGVHPGDTCWRSDLGVEHRVISGHNATATWRAVGAGNVAVAGAQPLDSDLTAIAAQGVSSWGLARMADAGATAAKNALSIQQSDVAGLPAALRGKQAAADALDTLSEVTPGPTGLLILAAGAPSVPSVLSANAAGAVAWVALESITSTSLITYTPGPRTGGEVPYPLVSAGDTNGVCYALGVAAGSGTWTNPHTAGALTVVITDGWSGIGPAALVDRTLNMGSGYGIGVFVGVDIGAGHVLRPNAYSLRGYANDNRYLRNWVFEATNSVTANTAAAWDAASWTALDTRVDDGTMVSSAIWGYSCTQPSTAYRYFRWRCTGGDSYGAPYFTPTEIELYGAATGLNDLAVPAGYTGWATDGAGHWWPYL